MGGRLQALSVLVHQATSSASFQLQNPVGKCVFLSFEVGRAACSDLSVAKVTKCRRPNLLLEHFRKYKVKKGLNKSLSAINFDLLKK